jgi:hypothetical protein
VHSNTQLAYEVSRQKWQADPQKLDAIVNYMRQVEASSTEVMRYIDEMVDENHVAKH